MKAFAHIYYNAFCNTSIYIFDLFFLFIYEIETVEIRLNKLS